MTNMILKTFNICFLGTTGYGKSSLINALFGSNFQTKPIESCTKELYSVTLLTDQIEGYDAITIYDTPGIGEFSSNEPYQKYYNHVASIADCIVLVLTMQRLDSEPQQLLNSIKGYLKKQNVRFVIAINHIDSQEIDGLDNYIAWDAINHIPTQQCLGCIKERTEDILSKRGYTSFLPFNVIPVCCVENYGIEQLKKEILIIK